MRLIYYGGGRSKKLYVRKQPQRVSRRRGPPSVEGNVRSGEICGAAAQRELTLQQYVQARRKSAFLPFQPKGSHEDTSISNQRQPVGAKNATRIFRVHDAHGREGREDRAGLHGWQHGLAL